MPQKNQYPNEITLKVEKRVDRDDQNAFTTEARLKAAEFIERKWPAQFQELEAWSEEEGINNGEGYSRSHFQNVYGEYFGPVGSDFTFDEIGEGKGKENATKKDRSEMVEHELDIYERGVRFGYKLAKQEQGPPSYLPDRD